MARRLRLSATTRPSPTHTSEAATAITASAKIWPSPFPHRRANAIRARFDPLSRNISPTFQGYRLKASRYRPIRPAADRSLASDLGFRLRRQKRLLRVLEGDASEPIPSFEEFAAQKEELARQNKRLEAELRRLRRRSAGGNGQ